MNTLEGGRISPRQLYAIIVFQHLEGTISLIPSLTVALAGRDSQLSLHLLLLTALPLTFLLVWLAKRFPRQTIIQYSSALLGKPLGLIAGLAYIWIFLHIAALVARESADSLKLSVLPLTPSIVLIGFLVWLAVLSARGGIEVIGRLAESSFFLVMFFTVITLILPYNFAHPEFLRPVLDRGITPLLSAYFLRLGLLGQLISVNMAIPYLTKPEKATRAVLYAMLTSGILISAFNLLIISVFGPMAGNLSLPKFKLVRMISIGEFLERIEVIVLVIWIITALIKIAFFLWIVMLGLAQLFKLKGYRELAYPLGLIIIVLATLVYKNFAEATHFYSPRVWGIYSASLEFGLLFLLVGAALLRKKKGKQHLKST